MSELDELQDVKNGVENMISTVSQLKAKLSNLQDKPRLLPLRPYFLRADANLDSVDDNLREAGNELMKIEDEMYKLEQEQGPGPSWYIAYFADGSNISMLGTSKEVYDAFPHAIKIDEV